jgi:TRAP-type C4-dicarboxylate transport system permease small subunit
VALQDNGHLGTDMLVSRLGPAGKKICLGHRLVLMLFCLLVAVQGLLRAIKINWGTTSAVMEVSMSWFYASGMVFSRAGRPHLLNDLWRLLSGQMADGDLMLIRESEEAPHGDADQAR